jgi:hypothetical protein
MVTLPAVTSASGISTDWERKYITPAKERNIRLMLLV